MDFLKIGDVLLGVVVELRRNRRSNFVKLIEDFVNRVALRTHALLRSRSCGVTSSGTCKPRAVLIRWMCVALFGFAKCLQFHVAMKSQL